MKIVLIASIVSLLVLSFIVFPNANAVPISYNQNAVSITWTSQARNGTVVDAFLETGYNGTITSWYHNTLAGLGWSKKLGSGVASFTAPYLVNPSTLYAINGSTIFFKQQANVGQVASVNVLTGATTNLFHSGCNVGAARADGIFMQYSQLAAYCLGDITSVKTTLNGGNVTITTSANPPTGVSSQKFLHPTAADRDWVNNPTGNVIGASLSANLCELTYTPTNATIAIDDIACDQSIPNHANHYWYGIKPEFAGNYVTNSTYPLIQSIYSNQYQDILTLPDTVLGVVGPTTRFILHDSTGDYMFVLTSSTIRYATVSSILTQLSGHAMQTYIITGTTTTSNYEVPTTLLQNAQIYGPLNLNATIPVYGVMSIPSGYTLRLSTYTQATIRTLDPQWTNDNNLYPSIRTGPSSLFPIILTVNNAPTDGGLMVTNPNVSLVYTFEQNLVFWLSPVQNTLDYITGVYSSSTQPTEILTSWGSYAKNFTGSNKLTYPNSQSKVNFDRNQPFSVSFWAKTPATLNTFCYICKANTVGTQGWAINGLNGNTTEFRLTNTAAVNQLRVAYINAAQYDNNWHHYVITYSGNSLNTGVRIYFDNSNKTFSTTVNNLAAPIITTQSLTIGANSGGSQNCACQIADIKIYNTVLTPSQISTLFAHGTVNTSTQAYGNEIWTITRLDSTRTAEYDVPLNTCGNVFIADISQFPPVYTYEGSICATGSSVKTISYTNTLPLTFWSAKYGATSTFTPSSNSLSTTVRSTTSPFTYNVIIKNSTGGIARNFTTTINGTIDTHSFNVTNATKSASVYISIPGTGQIYSSYFGSPLSFASVVSFFHTYLSYQGFDFLSFIPLIFASMFTRNTVGIGAALTVVVIATLSFLSIVVVPDIVVYSSIVIAIFGMIGYRGLYG